MVTDGSDVAQLARDLHHSRVVVTVNHDTSADYADALISWAKRTATKLADPIFDKLGRAGVAQLRAALIVLSDHEREVLAQRGVATSPIARGGLSLLDYLTRMQQLAREDVVVPTADPNIWERHLVLAGDRIVAERLDLPPALARLDPHEPLCVVSLRGRVVEGQVQAYESLTVTRLLPQPPDVPVDLVAMFNNKQPGELNAMQRAVITTWLLTQSAEAWARASEQVRTALGDSEPLLSLAEAARRAHLKLTTLDAAVRAQPPRVAALVEDGGRYRVRLSAVEAAIESGRLRAGRKKSTSAKKVR